MNVLSKWTLVALNLMYMMWGYAQTPTYPQRDRLKRSKHSAIKNRPVTSATELIGTWQWLSDKEPQKVVIKTNTIFFVSDHQKYRYTVKDNSIVMKYPWGTLYDVQKVFFHGDTLIMETKENGQNKFYRTKK